MRTAEINIDGFENNIIITDVNEGEVIATVATVFAAASQIENFVVVKIDSNNRSFDIISNDDEIEKYIIDKGFDYLNTLDWKDRNPLRN